MTPLNLRDGNTPFGFGTCAASCAIKHVPRHMRRWFSMVARYASSGCESIPKLVCARASLSGWRVWLRRHASADGRVRPRVRQCTGARACATREARALARRRESER
eukprot:5824252-Pleurochrysis_carterae.AAC.1